MGLILILIATLIASAIYYFIIYPLGYWKRRGVKQTNSIWLRIIDNFGITSMRDGFAEMAMRICSEHPGTRYSGVYQFSTPTLVIKDPDLLKHVTVKDFDHFMDHPDFLQGGTDPLWSKNLLALRGQEWKEMRSILTPSFTSSKMKTMFILMSEVAENYVEHFKAKQENLITLEMKDSFKRYATDIIASTVFGIKVDSIGETNNTFFLMGQETGKDFNGGWAIVKFMLFSFLPVKLARLIKLTLFSRHITEYYTNLMRQTVQLRKAEGIVRPDLVQLMLDAKDSGKPGARELDLTEMTAHAFVFFFAGFDTVSSLMSFMAYELALHPDIQVKVREEIIEAKSKCNGKNISELYDALQQMTYLDMVVSEALRKWPPNIIADRVCTSPYTIKPVHPGEKPLFLDIGASIWIPTFAIQRDPKYFPQPDRFDPERFSDENKKNFNQYAYSPFGLGPRNCIANRFALLEVKTIFFHLLSEFEIVPVDKTEVPLKIAKDAFPLMAENGFWLGLKRIKH